MADTIVVGTDGSVSAKRAVAETVRPNKASHHARCNVLIVSTDLVLPSASPASFERPLAAPGGVLESSRSSATRRILRPCPASTSDRSRCRMTHGRDHEE